MLKLAFGLHMSLHNHRNFQLTKQAGGSYLDVQIDQLSGTFSDFTRRITFEPEFTSTKHRIYR